MARVTDTRAQVRILAQKIADEGGIPTPTVIRQMLGRGSQTTIVDELKRWSGARAKPAPPGQETATVMERLGLREVATLLEQATAQAEQQRTFLVQAGDLLKASERLPLLVAEMTVKFSSLEKQLLGDREWMHKELELMNTRFEAMQRRALLQIEEAREESVHWRGKYKGLQDEFGVWRTTMDRRNGQLQDRVAWLSGKLGVEVPVSAVAQVKPSSPVTRPVGGYRGHPRAVAPHSDE